MISVVLSGGSGTRLWPLSRQKLPKQFSPLFEKSLFSQTVERLSPLGDVMVCTGEPFRVLTEKSIVDDKLKVWQSLYEPCARNTAPAVAFVCQYLLEKGRGDEVVGIFPADHWVAKPEAFSRAIELAIEVAGEGQVVTLGIQPSYPATGFGYIECLDEVFKQKGEFQAQRVKGFVEKPTLSVAESYVKSGLHNWNSGMFVFDVKTMVAAFTQFMPEMWSQIQTLKADLSNLDQVYQELSGQSLDYGIMEHIENQVCIPCDIGWSDLGSWDDVQTFQDNLARENNRASIFNQDSRNNLAYAMTDKVVCFNGIENIQVVDTPDILYVGQKGQSQKVKELLNQVKERNPQLLVDHTFEYRPWGDYKNLFEVPEFKVKVITVRPGQQLSYQSHNQREETWVVVGGQGEVVLNDETIPVKKGTVVQIPVKAKHRMRNTGGDPLRFVEVQMGDYFGEDDIIRYQDDYNRVK